MHETSIFYLFFAGKGEKYYNLILTWLTGPRLRREASREVHFRILSFTAEGNVRFAIRCLKYLIRKVPQIKIKNEELKNSGFTIDKEFEIIYQPGKITLALASNKEIRFSISFNYASIS